MDKRTSWLEVQNVENEGVDDERIFNHCLTGIKWLWPAYLSQKPGAMMDSVISILHRNHAVKYDAVKELLNEYNNAGAKEIQEVRNILHGQCYSKYFKKKSSSSTQQ